jgi:hypothetical protein
LESSTAITAVASKPEIVEDSDEENSVNLSHVMSSSHDQLLPKEPAQVRPVSGRILAGNSDRSLPILTGTPPQRYDEKGKILFRENSTNPFTNIEELHILPSKKKKIS